MDRDCYRRISKPGSVQTGFARRADYCMCCPFKPRDYSLVVDGEKGHSCERRSEDQTDTVKGSHEGREPSGQQEYVYEVINIAKREDPRSADHILHMVDKGYNQYFKYIIMPYTGKSLDYIKENVLKSEFAPHTAVQIAYQTHLALRNLHELGYIHRDVKPDNFVVGRLSDRNVIFIMDFGMSTKFEKTTANLPK
ncbi:unnamed protein product [Nippostrongylus brasiliensis]|uniref:non-specific serine/threonine protein kinase n=1 Tax=Nippostrongylus brasiliensis TaxID=27835 RepID=A0A0N4XX18_NIPBR|nr:unnamed protein product [Nippostrongylus brasiliensis]